MTEIKTAVKPAEVVIVRDEATALKVMGAELIKKQIAEQATICKEMVVDDESSAQIAQQQLTTLSKMMKAVQKKGKEIRAPFTTSAKLVKAVEDDIIGMAEKVIAEGKGKIQVYHTSLLKKNEAAVEEVAEQAEEEVIKAEISAEKKFKAIDCILKWWEEAFTKFAGCQTAADLKEKFEIYCWKKDQPYPLKDFNDLPEEATNLKRALVALKDLRKEGITLTEQLAKEADEEKKIDIQDQLLILARRQIALKKETSAAFTSVLDAINIEKEAAVNSAKAEVVSVQASVATANIPKFEYEYEVVDFSKVPDEFKIINAEAVYAWMKKNPALMPTTSAPLGMNGLKFTRTVKEVRLA